MAIRRWQYPSRAKPVTVPAPPAVPAIDWLLQPAVPVRRPPAPPQPTATELVLDEGQRPEAVSLDRWYVQRHNPPLPTPQPQQPASTELVLDDAQRPEATSVDRYWRETEQPRPAVRPHPLGGETRVELEIVAVPEIPFLQLPDPVRLAARVPPPPPELVLDESQRPETITLDKWLRPAEEPLRLVPSVVPGASVLVPLVELAFDWAVQDADVLRPPARAEEGASVLPEFIEVVEIPNDWDVRQADLFRLKLAAQPTVTELLLPEEPTLDRWTLQYHNPTLGRPAALPWMETRVDLEIPPEILTLDKWLQYQENPVLPRPPRQFHYALGLLALAAPEVVGFVIQECVALWQLRENRILPDASGYVGPVDTITPSGWTRTGTKNVMWEIG